MRISCSGCKARASRSRRGHAECEPARRRHHGDGRQRRAISERTKTALAAANARGVKLGGRPESLKNTELGRQRGAEAPRARAAARAKDLAPVVAAIRAEGITSATGIAKALNERGIPIGSGRQMAGRPGAAVGAPKRKPMVIVSLQTGMRRGELFALTWQSVDLVAARIIVHGATAKSGTTRHLPLNSEALAVLRGWHGQVVDNLGLIFPGKGSAAFNNVRRSWEGVLAAAPITRFRWHDLRHTFASKLVSASVDLNTVREPLGHSDYKMTQRYAHLAPEHKAAAVERLVVMTAAVPIRASIELPPVISAGE